MSFCTKCGTKSSGNFCSNCGSKIADSNSGSGDRDSPSRETRQTSKQRVSATPASRDSSSHPSDVGEVVDCAHPGGGGCIWRAILYFLFGIPLTGFGLLGIVAIGSMLLNAGPWAQVDPNNESPIGPLLFGGVVLLFGWLLLATGVKRWREASDRRFYFRVGRGGISVCVPDVARAKMFSLSYPIQRVDVTWSEITRFKCVAEEVNADAPFGKFEFLIETTSKQFIGINTRYFVEDARKIYDNLLSASGQQILPG